ncbi:MAG TPA: hypothetical protein VGB49_03765, partial [Caulobacteraceae bacterium]
NLLASLTRAMTADGKPCEVTNFRALGVGQDNGDVVELKCASGSGFIAEIPQDRARAGRVLTCAVSVQRGGDACEL